MVGVDVGKAQRKPKLVSRKLKKYFLGGEASALQSNDFRSVRLTVPARYFGLVKSFRVPLDPIDLRTWAELQALPDDVCIQTTEYHGTALKVQQTLHSAWISKIGFSEDGSLANDVLDQVAFEVEAEWGACTFLAVHGFYRQAISSLRAALERTIFALRYQDAPSDPHLQRWLEGRERLSFQPVSDQLLKANHTVAELNERLLRSGCAPFLSRKGGDARPEGWVGGLYAGLCHYSHCRPNHTSGALWHGPGPVYDPDAFKLTDHFFRETSVVCWIAAKIARCSIMLPQAISMVITSAERAWKRKAECAVKFLA